MRAMQRPDSCRAAPLVATLSSAAVLGSTLLASSSVHAALPLDVTFEQTIDGTREYSEITVRRGGVLRVKPLGSGLGWLHLKANRITIEQGGSIDAAGAGYQGKDGSDGGQPNGTSGAGKLAVGLQEPGTGGANAGAGGHGTEMSCTVFAAPEGGVAYAMPSLLDLGSAGGSARVVDATLPSRGGHGGGRITLEAARIVVNGIVTAQGGDGINPSDIGSGGGAGGVIQILAASLTGTGELTVRGGAGGAGARSGGGGGGGLLVLATPTPASMLTFTKDLAGGVSGACNSAGAGGEGRLVEAVGAACLDADKDGFLALECGGNDCDDADEEIHPKKSVDDGSVIERCDNQDNDCNQAVDDNLPPGACPSGTCEGGVCVPDFVGAGGSVVAGSRPDHIEYVGGCATAGGSPGSRCGAGASSGREQPPSWALTLVVFALAGRRWPRRASRGTSGMHRGPRP